LAIVIVRAAHRLGAALGQGAVVELTRLAQASLEQRKDGGFFGPQSA
jgi:hypothetical protein